MDKDDLIQLAEARTESIVFQVSGETGNKDKLFDTTSRNIIKTNEEKIKLCLRNYQDSLINKDAWQTPLGIFLAIIVVFPTTEFTDYLGISKYTWEAVFIISGILSGIWLVVSLAKRFFIFKKQTIDNIVEELKNPSDS